MKKPLIPNGWSNDTALSIYVFLGDLMDEIQYLYRDAFDEVYGDPCATFREEDDDRLSYNPETPFDDECPF